MSSFGYSGTIAHLVAQGSSQAHAAAYSLVQSTRTHFRRTAFGWHPLGAEPLSTIELEGATAATQLPAIHAPTPFLGVSVSRSATEGVWDQQLSPREYIFLTDHRVGTVPLLPGTCYIEMARAVVRSVHAGAEAFDLTAVAFSTILFLDELDSTPTIRVALSSSSGGIAIASWRDDGSSDDHATMALRL